MLDRNRLNKQETKAGIIAIAVTALIILILSVAINMTGRCAECGKYVHRWQPAVYTSDGCVHHYGCLEDKYHKEAER